MLRLTGLHSMEVSVSYVFYDAAFMLRFMVAFVCLSTDRRGSIYGHRWHPIRRNRSEGKVLLELGVGRFGSD